MDNKYEFSITKVNYIISGLSEEERIKIPQNVIDFFGDNSNEQLLSTSDTNCGNMFDFNDMDKKFLKIIDYYLNGY